MAFTVRIFGHQGIARAPITQDGGVIGNDSILMLHLPYLWNQSLTSIGTVSVASTVAAVPAGHTVDTTRLLRVEIPDGSTIRYEVNASGTATAATANSPMLSGVNNIMFGPNWVFSFIDATGT